MALTPTSHDRNREEELARMRQEAKYNEAPKIVPRHERLERGYQKRRGEEDR